VTASRAAGDASAHGAIQLDQTLGRRLKAARERSISPRSNPAVAIATFQPCPSPARQFSTGTRTSSKNSSAKPVSPCSCRIGRRVMPGVFRSNRMNVSPLWRFAARIGAEHAEAPVGKGRAA
jgi:hypothetical protein